MERNATNVDVQLAACSALRLLTTDSTDNQRSVIECGGLPCLFAAMDGFPASSELQASCCAVFRNLTLNADNDSAMASAGVLRRVLTAMRAHAPSRGVQEVACRVLRNLAACDDYNYATTIVTAGALPLVFAAMTAHALSGVVCEAACGALGNLAMNDAAKAAIARDGGVLQLLTALHTHTAQLSVAEAACGALYTLTYYETPCADVVDVDEAGIATVLAAIDTHPRSVKVQEAGWWIIRNILLGKDERCAELLALGGLQRIPACVDANLAHDYVLAGLMRAATSIAFFNDGANADLVVSVIGFPRVLAVMDAHPTSAALQSAVCRLLRNFAYKNPAWQAEVSQSKYLNRVAAAMAAHVTSADVQEFACRFYNNLLQQAGEVQHRIAAAGAVPSVLTAMDAHEAVAGLQDAACYTIEKLCLECPEVQSSFARARAIERVLRVMRGELVTAPSVQQAACCALIELARDNADNKACIVSSCGYSCVECVMEGCADAEDVQYDALLLLSHLVSDPGTRRDEFVEQIGVEPLLAVMDAHLSSADVQSYACRVLWSLADSPHLRSALIDTDCVAHVVAAMDAHAGVADLMSPALSALANLADDYADDVYASDVLLSVLTAMETHAAVAEVQLAGCWVLANLTKDELAAADVSGSGGLQRLFAAMDANPTAANVTHVAIIALGNVAHYMNAEQAMSFVTAGGFARLLSTMDAHRGDESVQRASLAALRNLCMHAVFVAFAMSNGMHPCVLMAMDAHVLSDSVQVRGCEVMQNVCRGGPAHIATVAQYDGGLARLYAALDNHRGDVDVAHAAAAALCTMAEGGGDAAKAAMLATGAVERLTRVRATHADTLADAAIAHLQRKEDKPKKKLFGLFG